MARADGIIIVNSAGTFMYVGIQKKLCHIKLQRIQYMNNILSKFTLVDFYL